MIPATAPVPALLHGLAREPGRPRLTWYGREGERIELSGHVLDNWVTKTANLLVEEYDCGPWTRVLVDLGAHWRTVVWALAVWRTGACVVLPTGSGGPEAPPADGAPVDVVVTARPDAHPARQVVAVALPALARRFDGHLPPGATDAAAAVMTYGDVLTYMPEPEPGAPALAVGTRTVSHADLLAWAAVGPSGAAGDTDPAPQARLLLSPATEDAEPLLRAAVRTYATDGSVVLCAPDVAVQLAADPARRERLVETERVTAVAG